MMSATVRRWLRYVLIALLGLGLVLLLLWAVVVVPPRLIDTSQIPDPAKRLEEVNGLRTTLAGVLGGLAVVAGAVVGVLNLVFTQRVQWRAQVTERFTRAIDQLGSEKLDVRIGAVYALEQIARDSAELHWPIMEVLTAYLREHAAPGSDVEKSADTEKRPPADHQAIATVIGRRRSERDPAEHQLDLRGTTLPGVEWSGADLVRAILHGAHLEGAILVGARLERAIFRGAHLERAILAEACLERANLIGAHLERRRAPGNPRRSAIDSSTSPAAWLAAAAACFSASSARGAGRRCSPPPFGGFAPCPPPDASLRTSRLQGGARPCDQAGA
jgi:hypothetical protein